MLNSEIWFNSEFAISYV